MSNNNFRYQPFVAVSGNLGGKVPFVDDALSSHEQEIYPTTSLDGNCIEFEFQTDRNYFLIWDSLSWHWSSNLSKDVVTILTRVRIRKRSTKKNLFFFHWNRNRRRRRRRGSSSYLCKQHNAFNIFKCWSVHKQSADLQFQWTLRTQDLHFKQLYGSHLWIQGSFALWRLWLWAGSWGYY